MNSFKFMKGFTDRQLRDHIVSFEYSIDFSND